MQGQPPSFALQGQTLCLPFRARAATGGRPYNPKWWC
jgi:hypothetical protein